MSMEKDNIGNVFLDVEVPEVVREKMDDAFLDIIKEREMAMKKEYVNEKRTAEKRKIENRAERIENGKKTRRWKTAGIVIAAALCVIVTAAVAASSGFRRTAVENGEFLAETETNESSEISVDERTFTLAIMGAELEKDKPVQLVSNDSFITEKYAGEWVMGGMGESVDYCINVPFTCQGNDIRNITYSINNGAFQVVQPKGESIIVDGQLYEGELNTGIIGGTDEESESADGSEAAFEMLLYKSFTLDYQKQSGENTWINICNERTDNGELNSLIFGDNTLEDMNMGIQKMLDNTVITCTVQYDDGTSKAVDILVNSCIMTCAEAGAEVKEDPDREEIFITFELK